MLHSSVTSRAARQAREGRGLAEEESTSSMLGEEVTGTPLKSCHLRIKGRGGRGGLKSQLHSTFQRGKNSTMD